MFRDEKIYIAGPECFYTGGSQMLAAMRKRAESLGFGVTLPNDHPLDMGNPNLQKRADSIFEDLKKVMLDTTVIIADLESYRGSEPDSGTIYEIGMAYAKGARCYGYTRDKRPLVWKDQRYTLKGQIVCNEHGNPAPYKELPFSPNIIGSTKIVEGDFADCLKMLMTDIEEEYKCRGLRTGMNPEGKKEMKGEEIQGIDIQNPLVYLSGPERYDESAVQTYTNMKKICGQYGLIARTPIDWADGVNKLGSSFSYMAAANLFDNNQQHVRDCDAIVANLNDYRGYEVSNDVAFECGMAFQLGKKLYGYLDDGRIMKERIPNLGEEQEYRDMTGASVENFDYPLNLMFSCSMKVWEGRFHEIISEVAKDLKQLKKQF